MFNKETLKPYKMKPDFKTDQYGWKIDFNEYTYWEFVNFVKNTPKSEAHDCDTSSTGAFEFSGTHSWKEAMNLAVNGWDAGIKQLELEEGVAVSGTVEYQADVHGAVVNVEAYLQGQPECMWNIVENREFNLEPLVLYVQLDYLANITLYTAMKYCQKIIEYVNKYQARHNVKLVGIFESKWTHKDIRQVDHVIIKDFDQRFVLNNIAFAFHPAFFRRLWFKAAEVKPYCEDGYGKVYRTREVAKRLQAMESFNDKALLFPSLQETRANFKEEDIVRLK